MMAYRCWSHVALAVSQLRQAEEFYAWLFGLTVAFREAEASDGWRTLPDGTGWDEARAAGIEPGLSSLHTSTELTSTGARTGRWFNLPA